MLLHLEIVVVAIVSAVEMLKAILCTRSPHKLEDAVFSGHRDCRPESCTDGFAGGNLALTLLQPSRLDAHPIPS